MTGVGILRASCVVVGSGIAGLSAALAHGDCIVISKTALGEGSSRWAQGGIAAAIGDDDRPALHAADTHRVAGGIGDREVMSIVTRAAPEEIRWLTSLGADFDTGPDAYVLLGQEAGHGRRRIVHARGDATGAEVMQTLVRATSARPDIRRLDDTFVLDLLRHGPRVVGVLACTGDGEHIAVVAPAVVLATGGLGRIYEKTTNPSEISADGLAMAARAGVVVRDPEFVQFHPTALDASVDPLPLLTEALRGEGAQLIDETGYRFMVDVHPDAELAPRDVVARENWRRRHDGGRVYLDARMIGADLPDRFPTVWRIARRAGLDPRQDPLPVSPAQHYHMGGIATDAAGRTSLAGLYACGEAASTGLHGANRLASNSLLEGLVLGRRVAEAMAVDVTDARPPTTVEVPGETLDLKLRDLPDIEQDVAELRGIMWAKVGVMRDRPGLEEATARLGCLSPRLSRHPLGRNLIGAARLVTAAALDREESRGSHYRSDHPEPGPHPASTLIRPPRVESTVLELEGQNSRVCPA